jgi:hypothetical protein
MSRAIFRLLFLLSVVFLFLLVNILKLNKSMKLHFDTPHFIIIKSFLIFAINTKQKHYQIEF